MGTVRDWNSNRDLWIRILKQQTSKGLDYWNSRIAGEPINDEEYLRSWLSEQGVTGYAATLLVMERFGYPDFVTASAAELIDRQYEDRPHLRPIYDAIIAAVAQFGDFTIQARKSYVSLLTPRRTFARVRPTTKNRVDVGLRLEAQSAAGRLRPSTFQKTMSVQLCITSIDQLDDEARSWLRQAFRENS